MKQQQPENTAVPVPQGGEAGTFPHGSGKKQFHPWASTPIKYKLAFLIGLMLLMSGLMIYLTFSQSDLTMRETYRQENDYYNINSFQNTLLDAEEQLQNYLRNPGDGTAYAEQWRVDTTLLQQQLRKMNLNLDEVGTERYLLANALQNGFEPYLQHCETLLAMWEKGSSMSDMYHEYETIETISDYLQQYSRQLQSRALSDGQRALAQLRVHSQRLKEVFVLLISIAGFVLLALLTALVRSIVTPVLRLSEESKAIGAGDFDTPDVTVENRDEIYTLTHAFNHMKHSMKRLVSTLEERNEMEQELHQKELEASENRRLMEQAKMQQLRSQINPHFLFNTLNIISRTARREQARGSEKLILSLARLFRYSLKTDDIEVPLQREINIVNDYASIQATRFENRVALRWRIAPDIDPETLLVPAFMFQPVVENSIIHGLEPKVGGGLIRIRVHLKEALHIIISDNGIGMDSETLARLMGQQVVRGDVSGIGIGNVKSRLQMLDPNARFQVHSRAGRGTSVHITLTQLRFAAEDPPRVTAQPEGECT